MITYIRNLKLFDNILPSMFFYVIICLSWVFNKICINAELKSWLILPYLLFKEFSLQEEKQMLWSLLILSLETLFMVKRKSLLM